jgi:hypothetical protein
MQLDDAIRTGVTHARIPAKFKPASGMIPEAAPA